MYTVFVSGKNWSNLIDAISKRLTKVEKIYSAQETIFTTSRRIDTIVNNSKKLDFGIHAKKPRISRDKKSKYY